MTTVVVPNLSCPTDRWLATVSDVMPPLTGPAGTAERLLLLLHYGIDWDTSWVAKHRGTYWEHQLPDRVYAATYRSDTLRGWWNIVAADLVSSPRYPGERVELAQLLQCPPAPVLQVLREETVALVLRTRIVAETVRAARVAG